MGEHPRVRALAWPEDERQEDDLLWEVFGTYWSTYQDMAADRSYYWKDLMRFQEELVLVPVEALAWWT